MGCMVRGLVGMGALEVVNWGIMIGQAEPGICFGKNNHNCSPIMPSK